MSNLWFMKEVCGVVLLKNICIYKALGLVPAGEGELGFSSLTTFLVILLNPYEPEWHTHLWQMDHSEQWGMENRETSGNHEVRIKLPFSQGHWQLQRKFPVSAFFSGAGRESCPICLFAWYLFWDGCWDTVDLELLGSGGSPASAYIFDNGDDTI